MLVARVSWPVVLQITASEAPERSPEAFSKAFQQGRGESSGSRPPKSCGQTSQRWHMLFYALLPSQPVGGGGPRAQRVLDPPPPAKHGKRVVDHTEVRFFYLLQHLSISKRSPWRPRCARRPPAPKYLHPLLDAQDRPKIAPKAPRSPQEASRSPQNRLKIAQDPPKIAQDGLKIAQDGPRAAQDAFGALLGPLRVSLGAS